MPSTTEIANMQNEIHTNGNIVLGGRNTNFYVSQRKSGTEVFWWNRLSPNLRISVDMPQNRYSLVSETPTCGNGRSMFFEDLTQVMQANPVTRQHKTPSGWKV